MREHFWTVVSWLTSHWGVVLFVMVFVLAFSYLITGAVLSMWSRSESRRQADERARLDQALKASDVRHQDLRLLQASRPPAAPGQNRKRVS